MAAVKFLLLNPEFMEASGCVVDASSSSAAATMPWSNLFTQYPFQKARTSNLTTPNVIIDLGQTRTFTHLWLGYSNARAATDWRIRVASSEANLATATGDDDSGTIDFWPASVPSTFADDWPRGTFGFFAFASSRSQRWLQIDFTDATHPDGYLEFGVLVLANAWSPLYGPEYPVEDPTERERPERTRTYSGYLSPVETPRPTQASYNFGTNLSAAEYRELRRILRLRGASKHVVTVCDPDTTSYLPENTVHGLLSPDSFSRSKFFQDGYQYSAHVAIESMG